LFLGLEILSVGSYVLAAFLRSNPLSAESSLKYLILGAMSSAFLLYGMASLYGVTGTTALQEIGRALPAAARSPFLAYLGVAMLLVGFGFKIAAVPFHMWAPDVYEGAPTAVTAFFTAAPKVGALAGILRVFQAGLGGLASDWTGPVAVVAVLTMTVGNIGAVAQREIKRMLAYSSIAHPGYLLIGLAVPGSLGFSALVFYLVAYALMNLGAFAAVAAVERDGETRTEIAAYAGLARSRPGLALALTIFLVSLSGLPPTVGFVAKFYIFSAAVKGGMLPLAIAGVLNSLVSVYYYLRVTVVMYMRESEEELRVSADWASRAALAVSASAVLALGVFPARLWEAARRAASGLF